MKTKSFLLFCLVMALQLISIRVMAEPVFLPLQVGYDEPTEEQDRPHKGPILVPRLYIEDNVLTFETFHPDYTLTLFDEDGEVVYQTAVLSSTDTVVLPSTLNGNYVLTLDFGGSYYFWSEITL